MQIIALAIYAAAYPTLLATVGILVAHPRRHQLLTVFLFAGMAVSIGCGIGIVVLIHGSGAVEHHGSGWSWGTDLVVGSLSLLLAVALATHVRERLAARRAAWRGRRAAPGAEAPTKEPWSQRLLSRGSLPIVVIAAVLLNVPGAVYLVALKDIAAERYSIPVEVVWVSGFNLIMFLLAEVPWLGLMLAPERTTRLVGKGNDFLTAHGNTIATVVCTVFGLHLVIRGVIRS